MTRLQAVVALLQAWLDYFPWPETWTGELQRRSTSSGPAPFRRQSCLECKGTGKTRAGWICSSCKGRGFHDVDAYTGELVATRETPFRELLARFVNCSRCGGWGRLGAFADERPSRDHELCPVCEGSGRVPAPFSGVIRADTGAPARSSTGDSELDSLAQGHEKRDDLAVYRTFLLPAMIALRRTDRYGHLLVEWVWILGARSPRSLPGPELVRLLAATIILERLAPPGIERKLPGEIRAQHDHQVASLSRARGKQADRYAQRARDEAIRSQHRGGASLDELAERFKLDKSRISRIVRGV